MAYWSQEDDELLRAAMADKKTFSQIAEHVFKGRHSRNACIGRAGRMGLKSLVPRPKADPNSKRGMKRARMKLKMQAQYKAVEGVFTVSTGQRKSLLNLRPTDCRFPYGDVGEPEFGFCGAPQQEGSSYCPYHHSVCWIGYKAKRPGAHFKLQDLAA